MDEHGQLNRAGRRALQRTRSGRRRAALSSGAVLSLGSGLFGGAKSAGAEVQSLVVTIEEDITDPTDGEISLREAAVLSNETPGEGEITFAPDVVDVVSDDAAIAIFEDLTIDGPGVTVSAS